jgi:uncharacterized protein YigA (DUF484 family)
MYDLTSFGAAGLMGSLWLWERKLSRRREEQLNETHERIIRDEERLEQLVRVVEQNTSTLSGFTETQRQVVDTLKDLVKELHRERSF